MKIFLPVFHLPSRALQHNLLHQFQSVFKSPYSADSCLIHLIDHIELHTSKGLFTGMSMIDLQKAFVTMDHQIVCQKLRCQMGWVLFNWKKAICNCKWDEIWTPKYYRWSIKGEHFRSFPVLSQLHVFQYSTRLQPPDICRR